MAVIDLDGCRRPDGKMAQWAGAVMKRFSSYTEVSPSGTGLKIFVPRLDSTAQRQGAISAKLDVPQVTDDKRPGLEVFICSRFVTVTGRRLKGSPNEVAEQTEALASLLADYFPARSGSVAVTDGLPTVSEMRDRICSAREPSTWESTDAVTFGAAMISRARNAGGWPGVTWLRMADTHSVPAPRSKTAASPSAVNTFASGCTTTRARDRTAYATCGAFRSKQARKINMMRTPMSIGVLRDAGPQEVGPAEVAGTGNSARRRPVGA